MSRPVARLTLALAGAIGVATSPGAARAQRPSQHGIVSQTVDSTTVTIEYDRPVARGRALFGGIVRWGRAWTPGANWATTIEVDRDVRLNGNPLPKGKYSIWAIPQTDEWTLILSRAARRFHTRPPDEKDEQLRFTARPEQRSHLETLTFYFPVVTPDGATLALHWGTTLVPVRVTVEPSRPTTISEGERGVYPGTYRVTPASPEDSIPPLTLEVSEADGRLRARSEPALWGYDATFDLIPLGDRRFLPSFSRGGKVFGVEREMEIVFKVEGARAAGLEVVWLERIAARGERQP